MKYVRIYTGPDGESHFEDLEMETTVREFTANVPPVTISQTFPGTGVFFVSTRVTPEFEDVEFHTAPRKMLAIQMKGVAEHETSDVCCPDNSIREYKRKSSVCLLYSLCD